MKLFHCPILLFLALFVGCQSNKYEEYYSVVTDAEIVSTDDLPKQMEIITKKQLNELMRNDNYILIGKSYFYDSYIPRTFAVDCAKKHGATVL